jgi:hypothetical protein
MPEFVKGLTNSWKGSFAVLVAFLCIVADVDNAVNLFGGGVFLPEAKLVIRYYLLILQGWLNPRYEELLEKF